ncbi:MAG: tripartite tricarboxylate transporter TctB family protein [Syntrophobacterales bacterium]|nr:tripartite tricarboxylate transporter TctB family protein [Syntrophobacterales bacterium]
MKKADLVTGVVLLVLAGYVIHEAWLMPPSGTFGPGSGFLPFWLGIILAGLSLILVVGAAVRPQDSNDVSPFPARQALLAVAKVLGGLVLFTLLMETVGFIANTFIFVLYLMKVVQRERWLSSLLIAAATTASLFIVFQVLLGISLPKNMFGF